MVDRDTDFYRTQHILFFKKWMTVNSNLDLVLNMGERGLVDVEIAGKGDGTYQDGKTRDVGEVKIKTNRGDTVWVADKDVYARKPNPEGKSE